LTLFIFSSNNQGASHDAKDSVFLHPSDLVWFESLGGHGTVDDVSKGVNKGVKSALEKAPIKTGKK